MSKTISPWPDDAEVLFKKLRLLYPDKLEYATKFIQAYASIQVSGVPVDSMDIMRAMLELWAKENSK